MRTPSHPIGEPVGRHSHDPRVAASSHEFPIPRLSTSPPLCSTSFLPLSSPPHRSLTTRHSQEPAMRRPLIALTAVAASGTLLLSACAGGSSDVVAQPGAAPAAAATTTVNLYAYAVPKPA